MTEDKGSTAVEAGEHGCDIKVWCPSCKRSTYTRDADRYLCDSCGKIMDLRHEVHHEHFPHLSGDKDSMS